MLFSIPVAFPKQMPSPPQKESVFNLHKKPLACDCCPHYQRGHWGWQKLRNFPKLAGLINREQRFESSFIYLKVCFSLQDCCFLYLNLNEPRWLDVTHCVYWAHTAKKLTASLARSVQFLWISTNRLFQSVLWWMAHKLRLRTQCIQLSSHNWIYRCNKDTWDWCWRRLLRVPWMARSNQSILKEINPEYSLEGLMLKLKL